MWWSQTSTKQAVQRIGKNGKMPAEAYPLIFAFGFIFGFGVATANYKLTHEDSDIVLQKKNRKDFPFLTPEDAYQEKHRGEIGSD